MAQPQLLQGGDSGPALVPGKPAESLLIHAVEYLDEPKMPPAGKLSDREISDLKQWVQMGAPWPGSAATDSAPTAARGEFQFTDRHRNWWAYQPVRRPQLPHVKDRSWCRNEVDNFVLAELESHDLQPSPDADRRAWIRRVTYDLTGLPPTPFEVDSFLADDAPDAYEVVVDRLLASPAYGQRWARHWLDVARYADYFDANPKTRVPGYELTEAWRYRDWVVNSFNRDFPFDQFIVHQIAGDLLPNPDGSDVYPDGLIATTFLTNGVWDFGDADKEKIVSDMADDNIDVIGKSFMGMTLGCARCHDHKFDPVAQSDYYALAGMFYSSNMLEDLGEKGGEYFVRRVPTVSAAIAQPYVDYRRKLAEINVKIRQLNRRMPRPPKDDPERVALDEQQKELEKNPVPAPPTAMAIQEGGTPGGLFPGIQDVPIHIRGSYAKLGEVVPRRLPRFFAGETQTPIQQGSGRHRLATWVASPDNPLTARVIVNRIWQWHFGRGLVSTPSYLGVLSEPPSHPALLDWLASEMIKDGWSVKNLHRMLLLSSTYRQSSMASRDQVARDPENRWLGRFAPRRLEAEAIRDTFLVMADQLDTALGGPASDDITNRRRSLYVQTARWQRDNFATLFDAANPDASTDKRVDSTVAPQSLMLMNHDYILEQARELARRIVQRVPGSGASRVQYAYQLLYGRMATNQEIEIAKEFLGQSGAGDDETAWWDLAHVLICSNELVYLD